MYLKNQFHLKFILVTIMLTWQSAFATIKIEELRYEGVSQKLGRVIVSFTGKMRKLPEVQIRKGLIQLEIAESKVWPKINRKVSLASPVDTTLIAYQYNKDVVRVRTILPYQILENDSRVNVVLKENEIVLNFPLLVKTMSPVKKKAAYDESLIKSLISDKSNKARTKLPAKLAADFNQKEKGEGKVDPFFGAAKKINNPVIAKEDTLKEKSEFSISNYVYKFIIFLGLILGALYLVVKFFKKGVMKKNKLGFLTDSDLVSVLNTTYIGPKRSLLLVKAYDQVILLGNSENGIHYLSEVKNLNQLLKETDKLANGTDFDTELDEVMDQENINLKEKVDIKKSSNHRGLMGGLDNFLAQSKKVAKPTNNKNKKNKKRYKDQLKEKMKDLKPLQ